MITSWSWGVRVMMVMLPSHFEQISRFSGLLKQHRINVPAWRMRWVVESLDRRRRWLASRLVQHHVELLLIFDTYPRWCLSSQSTMQRSYTTRLRLLQLAGTLRMHTVIPLCRLANVDCRLCACTAHHVHLLCVTVLKHHGCARRPRVGAG